MHFLFYSICQCFIKKCETLVNNKNNLKFHLTKSVGLDISITPCKQRAARGIDVYVSVNSVGV
jgi:hypothetical protein